MTYHLLVAGNYFKYSFFLPYMDMLVFRTVCHNCGFILSL